MFLQQGRKGQGRLRRCLTPDLDFRVQVLGVASSGFFARLVRAGWGFGACGLRLHCCRLRIDADSPLTNQTGALLCVEDGLETTGTRTYNVMVLVWYRYDSEHLSQRCFGQVIKDTGALVKAALRGLHSFPKAPCSCTVYTPGP